MTLKTWKNRPQKLLIIGPQCFFQYILPKMARSAQAVENPYSFFNVSYTWYKSLPYPLLMVSSTATFTCSDHIAELGNTTPVKPMLFMKPPSTYIKNGTAIEVKKILHWICSHKIQTFRTCIYSNPCTQYYMIQNLVKLDYMTPKKIQIVSLIWTNLSAFINGYSHLLFKKKYQLIFMQ